MPVSPVLTVSVPFVGGLRPHDMRNPDIDGLVGGKRCHPIGQDRLLHERAVTVAVGTHVPVGEKVTNRGDEDVTTETSSKRERRTLTPSRRVSAGRWGRRWRAAAAEGERGEGPGKSSAAMLPGPGAADSDRARPAMVTAEAGVRQLSNAPGLGRWQSSLIYRRLPERSRQVSVVRTVWEGPE